MNRIPLLILVLLFGNLFSFDFYGIKSGMSRDEIIKDYFGIEQSYIDKIIVEEEQEKIKYPYLYPQEVEELVFNHLSSFVFRSLNYKDEKISMIKENHILKTVESLESIRFTYSPEGEVLISLSAIFVLDTPYDSNVISKTAFQKILADEFPSASIEVGPWDSNEHQATFILTFIDEKLMTEWIDKYYNKLNNFN